MLKKYRYVLISNSNISQFLYYYAERIEINRNGDLLFLDYQDRVLASIARGCWQEVKEDGE